MYSLNEKSCRKIDIKLNFSTLAREQVRPTAREKSATYRHSTNTSVCPAHQHLYIRCDRPCLLNTRSGTPAFAAALMSYTPSSQAMHTILLCGQPP